MRRQMTASIVLLSLGLLWLAGCQGQQVALTSEEKNWLAAHANNITVTGDPNYPPIDYIDSSGKHTGLAEELLQRIGKRLGITFVHKAYASWDEALKAAMNHEVDLIKCIGETPERLQRLYFTQPFLSIPNVFIVNNHFQGNLSPSGLLGKSVAVSQGYLTQDYLKRHYPGVPIELVRDDSQALMAVSTGKVAVAVSDLPSATYLIDKLNITNLRVGGEMGCMFRFCFGSRNDWPILNSIMSKALEDISGDELKALKNKWISLEYSRFLYSRLFWWSVLGGVVFIGALMLFIRLWNRTLYRQVQEKTRELNDHREHLEQMVGERTKELLKTNRELQAAVEEISTLKGIIPICAKCKRIRNDTGYWDQIESYVEKHSLAEFTHGLCPECEETLYGKTEWFKRHKKKKKEGRGEGS